MSPRSRRVTAGIVAGIAVVVGVIAWQSRSQPPRQPPPLKTHAADVYRLALHPSVRGIPPVYRNATVTSRDGSRVVVALGPTVEDRKSYRNRLVIGRASAPDAARTFLVAPGAAVTAYGVRVTVLDVWRQPAWAYDAADIRADPVR